ncbi:MAG: CO dehydrogenase/acetyl-CoA synthase complex subunit alpha [Candidatus Undinarchaeales archaeon]|jgi:acetyl-CoA decarbonylase/synthase complex subunit alpha|nr:CO dehydrogenase/acetyl-CoA synthase complex subunit alpha [Candidatus Undinarchaeales archaeon]MDP7492155.1 CO dehydrogenase/acetyl-CoA synthase complex subunit alpha [Candidatus Undinarchaeales archaeon]
MGEKEADSTKDILDTDIGKLQINIGEVVEDWEEEEGPTPFPGLTDLREWDHKLLKRYKPFYMPASDICDLCTMGKCDLMGKKGACGIKIDAQQARIVLLACCIGASAHAAHARHLLEVLIEREGANTKVDLGGQITIEAPLTRLITGIKPRRFGDFRKVLNYCEAEIIHALASTHTGDEGDDIDLNSKTFHVSMIDILAMEVADIIQIIGFDMPKGESDTPLVDIGMGVVDSDKPVILLIGHNLVSGTDVSDYLDKNDLYDKVELAGICCTSHDITRHDHRAKVIGPLSMQLRFLKMGVADVIVVDEQCIRTDVLEHAKATNTPLLTTSNKATAGLPDMTNEEPAVIIDKLKGGEFPGAYIPDFDKVGEVAVELARDMFKKRKSKKNPYLKLNLAELASTCTQCQLCRRNCHFNKDVPGAMKKAADGDESELGRFFDECMGCGKCESACDKDLPITEMVLAAAKDKIANQKSKLRVGRGPIQDVEIRTVGQPIVFGEIPGIIAMVGCPNHEGGSVNATIAEEFLKRGYIVAVSGCTAMDIAIYSDLFERYPGDFDKGCLVNVGSCVANAHILGAAVKVAAIFAHRKLRANYEEIADYILNRLGAVGIAWGAYAQKAASIATGVNRMGIPVIVGPQGNIYRRLMLGDADDPEAWTVLNARDGEQVQIDPCPEHLLYVAETVEETIVMACKLCIRPNDTTKGRQIKLSHYIDLSHKYLDRFPDDIDKFIRTEQDIPLTSREMLLKELKKKGWKRKKTVDPTLLERQVRV